MTEEYLKSVYPEKSAYSISDDSGFSVPIVYRYLRKFGLVSVADKEVADQVFELYCEGKKTNEISSILGISLTKVLDSLHQPGLDIRGTNTYVRKLPSSEKVCRLYLEENLSTHDIAKKYNVGSFAVLVQLRKENVDLRSKSETRKGELNPMKGKKHSKAARQKMCDAYANDIRDIPKGPRDIPTPLETPHQGTVTTRSSWEAAVGRYFNVHSIDYYYEPHRLELEIDGIIATYTPDFYLPAENKYVEVKGMWTEGARDKVDEALKSGYNVDIYDLEYLRNVLGAGL